MGADVYLGCRAGAECPFVHDSSNIKQGRIQSDQKSKAQASPDSSQSTGSSVASGVQNLSIGPDSPKQKPASSHVPHSQPQRPVSKIEQNDPREFQINQLRRRYRPVETSDDTGSTLKFGLVPSDPDFPFELDSLQCVLYVPYNFPGTGRPTLAVTNPEMEPAYQTNVGRGFDDIVDFTLRTNGRGTLLNWLNTLDRQLERLLTTLEKGPTLKFVANTGDNVTSVESVPSQKAASAPAPTPKGPAEVTTLDQAPKPPTKVPSYTAEQRASAEKRKLTDTKQLEARLGRLPLFQKRTENCFIIPIRPNKPDRLPQSLQLVKTVKLSIPHLYPLEHSSIEIQGVDSPEARSVEVGFIEWVEKNTQMNLVSQINYLASNMHNFAKTPLPEVAEQMQHVHVSEAMDQSSRPVENESSTEPAGDRPHLHVIPRPPEWSVQEGHSGSETTEESSYDEEEDEEDGEETDGGAPVPATLDTPGRGVALSFPFLELYGIELLEIIHLAITIKCERCKESMDIKNVPHLKDAKDVPKVESCKKCAGSMSIGR